MFLAVLERLSGRELLGECGEGHVVGDHIVREQDVAPRLAAVGLGVVSGVLAPLHRDIAFGDHVRRLQFVARFGLKHVDVRRRLGDEVGLVFEVVGAGFVENLELALRRLEPLLRFALQDDGELTLGVRLEFIRVYG